MVVQTLTDILCDILNGASVVVDSDDVDVSDYEYGYGDAIAAITSDSNMFSSDISRTVPFVKKGQSSDYYKAVIAVAKSDKMFSSSKRETIRSM